MNRAFLFFFVVVVVLGFFTVDLSLLGGQTVFGWLCPSSWRPCEGVGDFLRGIAP